MLARKLPARKSVGVQFHTYSIRENIVMHGLANGWAQRLGTLMMGKVARLELGEHKISEELRILGINETAHSGQYAEGVMTKLHDPDKNWNINTLV